MNRKIISGAGVVLITACVVLGANAVVFAGDGAVVRVKLIFYTAFGQLIDSS